MTSAVGALDASFLGRGRPLGSARVINAIGQGHADVASLREYLGLETSLMSRLLRGLEDEGLVETVPSAHDARCRVAQLTKTGKAEYRAYERLSNAQATAMLAGHTRPGDVLAAMDLIASALGRERIAVEEVDPRSDAARHCLDAYYAELAQRFEQGFDVARSRNPSPGQMMRPHGAFLLALSDGLPIGCVGLKGAGERIAEIKRLWIAPSARGLGLSRRLMTQAEDIARELSFTTLRLDTHRSLHEARQLYLKSGWKEIDRFNDDPYADFFFEKKL
ncbi:MAG TPA: helix-turn-helix domain-containing GNAT family N-acetyltransferase [Dyella sp.]|uniref:bifunctional helix-turn-helix transcriptional regulator/GNAT family N-acetyltransferase n=1 Tax=Dyella sp. TaxID=1869338 RepID=UPI002D78ACCD|nr:helix-turn-helix domain-containing GNAT family N-acetyltransferase [Dyella sp.]HET6555354.1 helix-turn-helix domain-containing GNAT family N-acetyltransferase [Dyella sp.]